MSLAKENFYKKKGLNYNDIPGRDALFNKMLTKVKKSVSYNIQNIPINKINYNSNNITQSISKRHQISPGSISRSEVSSTKTDKLPENIKIRIPVNKNTEYFLSQNLVASLSQRDVLVPQDPEKHLQVYQYRRQMYDKYRNSPRSDKCKKMVIKNELRS